VTSGGQAIAGIMVHIYERRSGEYFPPGYWAITDNDGDYVFSDLPPSNYLVSVLQGEYPDYQTNAQEIDISEGLNEVNIQLVSTFVGVKIDGFRLSYNGQYIDSILTITNSTGQTFLDQSVSRGRFRVHAGTQGFRTPGTDWERDYLTYFWREKPPGTVNAGFGNLSPGTHSYPSRVDVGQNRQRVLAGVTRGFVSVWFKASDYSATPIATLAMAEGYFEGAISSQMQEWQKTNWRPPREPDDDDSD